MLGLGRTLEPIAEALALHQLRHQVARAGRQRADIVQSTDVRVVQSGNSPRLALEASAEFLSGDLDRDGAAEAGVGTPEDLSHATFAQ